MYSLNFLFRHNQCIKLEIEIKVLNEVEVGILFEDKWRGIYNSDTEHLVNTDRIASSLL